MYDFTQNQEVLCRDFESEVWRKGKYNITFNDGTFGVSILLSNRYTSIVYNLCIPYKGNEYLENTSKNKTSKLLSIIRKIIWKFKKLI